MSRVLAGAALLVVLIAPAGQSQDSGAVNGRVRLTTRARGTGPLLPRSPGLRRRLRPWARPAGRAHVWRAGRAHPGRAPAHRLAARPEGGGGAFTAGPAPPAGDPGRPPPRLLVKTLAIT